MPSNELTGSDYRALSARWITMDWAQAAALERVDTYTAAERVGRADAAHKDYSGLWIPYSLPEGLAEARGALGGVYSGRIRRDHPEVTVNSKGQRKAKNKYLAATGDRNHLYFPPKTEARWLSDIALPIIITEGELKTLALRRLATHNVAEPRFLAIGLSGVRNWEGKIGKHQDADGATVDEHGTISDFSYLKLRGRRVIIAFDADQKTNADVRKALWKLKTHFMSEGCAVANLTWNLLDDGKEAKGIDDWLARDGPERVLTAIAELVFQDSLNWRSKLITFPATGAPKALLENARIALAESDTWTGKLVRDEFLNRTLCSQKPWGGDPVWQDEDSIRLACWLQNEHIEVGKETAADAIVAAVKTTDCAADWMRSLRWDGVARVDTWLQHYMHARTEREGVDITNYVSAVGRAWLVGGVARLLEPGCKMDYCLVLFGKEGLGKSSALNILANGWFMDSMKDITSQFAPTLLAGKFIVEFAELEGWGKAEKKDLKAFLSRQVDTFRAPHDRIARDKPRHCIFAGTTNEPEFIDDDGGQDRRFWPIHTTGGILLTELQRDVDQLWAEARTIFEDGQKPYITDEKTSALADFERGSFRQRDLWYSMVVDYLRRRPGVLDEEEPVTSEEVLTRGIKKEGHTLTHGDRMRVSKILRSLGFEPFLYGPKRLNGWRNMNADTNN